MPPGLLDYILQLQQAPQPLSPEQQAAFLQRPPVASAAPSGLTPPGAVPPPQATGVFGGMGYDPLIDLLSGGYAPSRKHDLPEPFNFRAMYRTNIPF